MTLDCEVIVTRSGARAMRDRCTGEIMHPVVGPLVEASRLYAEPSRLAARLGEPPPSPGDDPLVVLDVGLGAGSNAIAAWHVSEALPAHARRLEIVSFDRSLSAFELAQAPGHGAAFGLEGAAGTAARALLSQGRHDTDRTTWRLVEGELLSALPVEKPAFADVVFWDPFSPKANPELWTVTAFTALRRLCRDGATVHTYSSATAIRSALLLAGFAVGAGPEVGVGKQTTVATVHLQDLEQPLDARWLERLRRSSAPLPTDAPRNALERVAERPQFQSAGRDR